MKTKNLFYALSIAVAALTMTACSSESDSDVTATPSQEKPSENAGQATGTWQVTINAGPADQTRAISVGGNSGQVLYTNWDSNDKVQVVKGGEVIGTLEATPSTGNSAYAVLKGTLTGTFAVGDELTLCYHSATFDYTKQKGTLADVSTNASYLMATSTVTAINASEGDITSSGSGKLTMSDAAFEPQQAYLDITFTDDLGNPYDITKLEIFSTGDKLVSTKYINNDVTNYATSVNPLTVTPASATNHFFLALRDEKGASNTYYFTATTAYGELTYIQDLNLVNGHYYKASEPKILYVEPTFSIKTENCYYYQHTHSYTLGTYNDDTFDSSTPMEVTLSGISKGFSFDLNNPATVTLSSINATVSTDFIGILGTADYVLDIQGANTIITQAYYAVDAYWSDPTPPTLKLKGDGTLTITCKHTQYCGIRSNNYTDNNNIHATTDTEYDVTSLLAADGYTVKRSARIDNADGTYTWKYTVKKSTN